ncbi:Metallo-dependent phosphatase-like protein [Hypomontagnella submonticulosa]|nr:Metallo-dependent phosphatase-like protein [Hypomontagnella submonticulosa]
MLSSLWQNIKDQLGWGCSPEVQVVSDLFLDHQDQYRTFELPVSAPFLLLGGNVGRLIDYLDYRNFLKARVSQYKKVFLVLGDHEFFGVTYEEGIEIAEYFTLDPDLSGKFVLLHQTRWDDEDSPLTIIGCTLWPRVQEGPRVFLRDFARPPPNYRPLPAWPHELYAAICMKEVSWLRTTVRHLPPSSPSETKRRVLIATHYAPNIENMSRRPHGNLLKEPGWDHVRKWVFGHARHSETRLPNGIRLVTNQRCVPTPFTPPQTGETVDSTGYNFDPALTVTV